MKQITISRYGGIDKAGKDNWKDLISSLVLCGYEVYGSDEEIIFSLGDGDEIKEVKDK